MCPHFQLILSEASLEVLVGSGSHLPDDVTKPVRLVDADDIHYGDLVSLQAMVVEAINIQVEWCCGTLYCVYQCTEGC